MIGLDKAIITYIENFSQGYENKKILDMGCGKGNYTYFFGKRNKTIGIDLQDVVEGKYRNFDFQIADATNLPFQNNTFDLVVSLDVIEHIENDKKMLSEACRVLKKNGRMFLSTPNKTRLSHFLLKVIGKPVKYPLNLGTDKKLGPIIHIREYTAKELEKLIMSQGFRSVNINHFWLGLTPLRAGFLKAEVFKRYCHYLFVEATLL